MDTRLASVAKNESDVKRITEYGHFAICEEGNGFFTLVGPSGKTQLRFYSWSLEKMDSFDVVSLSERGTPQIVYAHSNDDNVIVLTDRCNSNCIMCPYTENHRRKAEDLDYDYICQLIDYLPSDIPHLIITGGEPTLLNDVFLQVIEQLKAKFENTEFLLLTNGRTMADRVFAKKVIEAAPSRILYGIPLHGPNSLVHDTISQVKGSFLQTVRGVKNLLERTADVEIRIVISRLNYEFLEETAAFLVKNLPNVNRVTFMAMEMCGAAAINKERVWIDYKTAAKNAEMAARILISKGIKVLFYNFPLCMVDKGFWPLCVDSITDCKIRFSESCVSCAVRSICGGVFSTTLGISGMSLIPVKE